MKVKATEQSVILVPESEWEREQLKRIQQHGVQKVRFEDAWEQTGGLEVIIQTNDWGT